MARTDDPTDQPAAVATDNPAVTVSDPVIAEDADLVKVYVPQEDGEIRLTTNAGPTVVYTVKKGVARVPSGAETRQFLRAVAGSRTTPETPAGSK